jgi:sensor histidine kinase YesM
MTRQSAAIDSSATRDPQGPNAGRIYLLLVCLLLGVQLMGTLTLIDRADGPRGPSQWLQVAINTIPAFPGSLLVWWYAGRRRSHTGAARWLHHLVGWSGFAVTLVACAALLRTLTSGSARVVALVGPYPDPITVVISASWWYTLFALAAGFSRGQASTWAATRRAEEEARARHAAELRMARAYLHPHFLFNALNTIASLIDLAPSRAREATVQTAELLRSSLRAADEEDDLIPLHDELGTARRYLAIERLRMERRLQVSEEVATDALTVRIPRFALQLLVENAIRHGLFPHPDGGTVTITAACTPTQLRLSVRDSGRGAVPGDVAASRGYGLRSLRERMRLHYGDLGALTVQTAPGDGFSVTMIVPRSDSLAVAA